MKNDPSFDEKNKNYYEELKRRIALGEKLSPEEQLFFEHLREQYDPFHQKDLENLKKLRKKQKSQKLNKEEKELLDILERDIDPRVINDINILEKIKSKLRNKDQVTENDIVLFDKLMKIYDKD